MKKIEQKVIKFIDDNDLIQNGDKILVALSGGPDSVFLLHFLLKFERRFQIEIGALHINHNLRELDSLKDEKFCERLAAKLSVDFFSSSKNIKTFAKNNELSLEEGGRIIRYKELEKVKQKNNFTKIATAHNSNDNAETVFLNLIKGAGIKGISGIPIKRGDIIRPLLNIKKEEVLNYLHHYKIKYRSDKTNIENKFERNFLRNKIFPKLKKKLNSSLENSLFNSSQLFKNYSTLIIKLIDEAEKESVKIKGDIVIISIEKIKSLHKELLGDFFKNIIERNFYSQLTFNDFERIKNLLANQSGKKINLSNKLIAVKDRNDLVIFKDYKIKSDKTINIRIGSEAKINNKTISIKKVNVKDVKLSPDKNDEYISANVVNNNFQIRKWKAGDHFYPLGLKGSKKISDFLNDQKIPSSIKSNQLVLTNNEDIVWVLGLRIDDRYKVTKKTKKALELCLK